MSKRALSTNEEEIESSDGTDGQPLKKARIQSPDERLIFDEELRGCFNLLLELMDEPTALPFHEPVDWKGLMLPTYPFIVTNPMDLGTIRDMLVQNTLANPEHFAAHVRLVFENAKSFNQDESIIYVSATQLLNKFNDMYEKLIEAWKVEAQNRPQPTKEETDEKSQNEAQIKEECEALSKSVEELRSQVSGIRNQINDIKKSQRQQSLVKRIKLTRPKQPLSYKQKEELCRKISELPPEYLPGLLPIIQSSSSNPQSGDEGVFEIEIEDLDDWTLQNVQKYVHEKSRLASKLKTRQKKSPNGRPGK